jgi:hypothetical protein
MSQLDLSRGYAEGEVLLEADLDAIRDGITTFFNTTKINDDNIQTSGIDAEDKVIDASVSTAKLATGAVTAAKLVDGAITTAKILDANVTTAKIADGAVTSSKILNGTLELTDFAANTIAPAKRAAPGQQVGVTTTVFNSSLAAEADVVDATTTITTTGKSVALYLMPVSGTGNGGLSTYVGQTAEYVILNYYRGVTLIATYNFGAYLDHDNDANPLLNARWEVPSNCLFHIDEAPAAAAYTYKVTIASSTALAKEVHAAKLVAFEIV